MQTSELCLKNIPEYKQCLNLSKSWLSYSLRRSYATNWRRNQGSWNRMCYKHQRIENKLEKTLSLLLLQITIVDSTEICSTSVEPFGRVMEHFPFVLLHSLGLTCITQSTVSSHPIEVSRSNRASKPSQKEDTTHGCKHAS